MGTKLLDSEQEAETTSTTGTQPHPRWPSKAAFEATRELGTRRSQHRFGGRDRAATGIVRGLAQHEPSKERRHRESISGIWDLGTEAGIGTDSNNDSDYERALDMERAAQRLEQRRAKVTAELTRSRRDTCTLGGFASSTKYDHRYDFALKR